MRKLTQIEQFRPLTRRDFIKGAGACAAVTSLSALSTLLNLRLTSSVMAAVDNVSGYKALVGVFLHGGIDSFNKLIPNDDQGYADYVEARGNLALDQSTLLPITDASGREFALHPGMPEVQQLFNDGKLAFLANVGTLLEHTTLASYQSKTNLPLGLFSHNDQQRHWQTAVPQSRQQITGWGGRMADCLTDASNSNPSVAMNISLYKNSIFLAGDDVVQYIVRNSGAQVLNGYALTNVQDRILTRVTDSLLEQTYSDLLEQTHSGTRRNAIDAAIAFNDATNAVSMTTTFPNTNLGNRLRMVALTIAAQAQLGHARQVFFVERGGWDHHDGLLTNQATMLPEVSQALSAFHDAMVEFGVENDVVLCTSSDFGRTLSTNGNGSDHAWGGNHIVMGGGVLGGRVHGTFPDSLAPGNPIDTGRGRLIPSTAVDEYAADLAMWFGVPNDSNLEIILPNIRNFFSAGASSGPVGLFGGSSGGGPSLRRAEMIERVTSTTGRSSPEQLEATKAQQLEAMRAASASTAGPSFGQLETLKAATTAPVGSP